MSGRIKKTHGLEQRTPEDFDENVSDQYLTWKGNYLTGKTIKDMYKGKIVLTTATDKQLIKITNI